MDCEQRVRVLENHLDGVVNVFDAVLRYLFFLTVEPIPSQNCCCCCQLLRAQSCSFLKIALNHGDLPHSEFYAPPSQRGSIGKTTDSEKYKVGPWEHQPCGIQFILQKNLKVEGRLEQRPHPGLAFLSCSIQNPSFLFTGQHPLSELFAQEFPRKN